MILSLLFFLLTVTMENSNESSNVPCTLTIRIENVANRDSNIMVAVFDSSETFLTETMHRQKVVPVKNFTEIEISFQLEKGEYAVAIYQDINKNGVLDRNFFSYPSEPFGFSKNFRPVFSAPNWSDVAIPVSGEKKINLKLK